MLAYYISYLSCLKYEKYMQLSSESNEAHIDKLVENTETT